MSRTSIIRDIGDMKPTIDLVWKRDAEGYDMVKAERDEWAEDDELPTWKYTPLADAGGYLLPEYKLLVDEAVRRGLDPGDEWWLEIRGKSGKDVPFRPFDGAPNLFRDFADIQTPEQALAFVNRNGLLAPPHESPRDVLEGAQIMHDLLVKRGGWIANREPLIPPGQERRLGYMELVLRQADPNEAPTLIFRPRTLLDGLFLQMSHVLAEEHPPRACRQCGKWFEGRRADAAFCSEKHRRAWYSLERTRRKHRAKQDAPSR
jgi:hypothetical protein